MPRATPLLVLVIILGFTAVLFAELDVAWEGLDGPENLAYAPDGTLWVTDTNTLWRIDAAGRMSAGYRRDPAIDGTSLCGVAPGPGGLIHFSAGNRILTLDPKNNSVAERAGGFRLANGICMDEKGNLYIADSNQRALFVLPADSTEVRDLKQKAGWVNGVFWKQEDRMLLCSLSVPARIMSFEIGENFEITEERMLAEFKGSGLDDFTVDSEGSLYICFYSNNKVVKIGPAGREDILSESVAGPSAIAFGRNEKKGNLLICEKGAKMKFDGVRILSLPVSALPYRESFQWPSAGRP